MRGKLPVAITLLQPLAEGGSLEASYNLALLLERSPTTTAGRPADWLQQAARGGLVDAYNRIQAGAIIPAPGQHVEVALSPADWIIQQNPRHYTLQLASSTRRSKIEKYYQQYRISDQGGYFHYQRKDRDWYALVYGSYPTISAARTAIENLPEVLRAWMPWIRRFRDIQKVMLPLDES
jgi:septal ring-binding cell division protein DamX